MKRVALRGLLGRKLRTTLTALAIVIGVAMVSGSYVLTDTIDKAFHSIFASSYEGTDAVVTGRKLVEWSQTGKATVSPALLAQIRTLPDVEAAAGTILDISGDGNQAKLLDKQGKVIQNGNPTFGLGVNPTDQRFNPMKLVGGAWASGPTQVVIDANTASRYGYGVGDSIGVAGDGPLRRFTVSGIARFGDVSSLGGATIALFDVPTAQSILNKDGFDAIAVAAKDDASAAKLLDEIAVLLPANAEVRTGTQQAEEDQKGIDEFVSFIRYFLLGFGGVALFVGAFVIFNTLSITVAQRTRELGTLRTLGASRRQVLRSVILEGLVLGIGASVIGLGFGVLLAKGLASLFATFELDLPRSGTVFTTRTAIVSLALGTLVTLVASLLPAIRATRIAPIAAVRDGAVAARKLSRKALTVSLVLLATSTYGFVNGTLASGLSTGTRILEIALGALGVFIGTALLAPRLFRPLASLVGSPSSRIGGVAGRLARENAVRNPARTASTAAALMIGLALVTFVAVLGRGLVASDKDAVRSQLRTSFVATSQSGWDTVPAGAGQEVAATAGVTIASSVRGDRGRTLLGREIDISGVDPATIARAYRFTWKDGSGSDAAAAALGANGALVRMDLADDDAVEVGDTISLETASGEPMHAVVKGIFDPAKLDSLLGHVVVSQAHFDKAFPRPGDLYTFVNAPSKQAVERGLAAYPNAKVQTQDEFVRERTAWLSSIMNLFYVLLALCVLVSLFGMVNTLVLSVFERTRELGMLRAVGMTRRQVRRMVRHEAIVTSLIGAALGLPLGIGLAAIVTRSLGKYGVSFSLPVGALV